ncbi:hypothetical protein ACFUJU_08015 [Streptomyces sp. NPDC057235]|uniref:hypothetical protein n=1 Tax=Streptomyces sp. NPDC057235 TaxID=3346058 RepID=UPI0036423933
MTQKELLAQLLELDGQYEQAMGHTAFLYADGGNPGAYHFEDGRVVYGVRMALMHMKALLHKAAEELEESDGRCHMRFDGDQEAASWPVAANGRILGAILNDERGYRARREAGGVAHVAPPRPFYGQALDDFQRWLDDPLNNLHYWTEILD